MVRRKPAGHIGVEQVCRTSNLSAPGQLTCRAAALGYSLSGLTGNNGIIYGRSLVHSDSTYLMAQLIGFTPWQAYQIMMYTEATDSSQYTPFDQNGLQMISDADIASCRSNWGPSMPRYCEAITPVLNGVYKFNDTTGGMLLHLHTRFSKNRTAPPQVNGSGPTYPANYFSQANAPYEVVVNNLRDWVFDQRVDACVAGIMRYGNGSRMQQPCADSNLVLKEPQNFFAAGFEKFAIPFQSTLGQLILNQDSRGTVIATNSSLGAYIQPHSANLAKMGIFVHSLEDRVSHHLCTDNSYFYQTRDGNYTSNYASVPCAQGRHFLWHVWEQGTNQSSDNLGAEYQTMAPALSAAFDQLVSYANHLGITVKTQNVNNKASIISNLIGALQIYEPQQRLNAMVALMGTYQALSLPGHGATASSSIEQWLTLAGAP